MCECFTFVVFGGDSDPTSRGEGACEGSACTKKARKHGQGKCTTERGESQETNETYTSISQNHWDQKVAAITKLLVFDEENDELETDVRNFVGEKGLISRQPF